MEHGQISEELSLLMAANGLRWGRLSLVNVQSSLIFRFGVQMGSHESLVVADRWAEEAAAKLLPQVLTEFGAIELMVSERILIALLSLIV